MMKSHLVGFFQMVMGIDYSRGIMAVTEEQLDWGREREKEWDCPGIT